MAEQTILFESTLTLSSWLPFIAVSIALFTILEAYRARSRRKVLPLPPGPSPLPLLGNVRDFPKKHLGPEFHQLSVKYGDVVHLQVLGKSIILLGTYEAAYELFEKRSSNYSDRPESAMVNLTGIDWIFVFLNASPKWRAYRRALHSSFVPNALPRYHSAQRQITRDLLRNLLTKPTDFSAHIKYSFAATILRIVYGLDINTPGDDKYYKLVERLAGVTSDISTPGQHLVEAFPGLQRLPSWFPGAGFKRLAAAWKAESMMIRDSLYASAKSAMRSTGVKECIITRLTGEAVDEELVRDVAATIYSAGSDTSIIALHAFVFAMAANPVAQRNAQAELDAVVGAGRLPDFSDQKALPYVAALVKEVLRWHLVAPIGGPRCSVADDEYNGYLIPGGSIIIPNQWAMSRDPAQYPDAERFLPERFLKNGQLNPDVRDPRTFVFGFGRRVCPGRNFAESAMFITCASILHTLDISPPLDENGAPRELEMKTNSLAVSHLEPFECCIVARNAHAEELIRASAA